MDVLVTLLLIITPWWLWEKWDTRKCKECGSKDIKWVSCHWWQDFKCQDCGYVLRTTHETGL